jgi:hypothetical protein
MLMNEKANFDLARRLRESDASLGEVFTFLSGLYFRGKLVYGKRFGRTSKNVESVLVITSDAGLRSPEEIVSLSRLQTFSRVPIDPLDPRYRKPLLDSALFLSRKLSPTSQVVLLGSMATNKYTDVLTECFGNRLAIPRDFIGRGDMSRGGLMLRAVESNEELEYVPLSELSSRRGMRPPKLPPLSGKAKRDELSGGSR